MVGLCSWQAVWCLLLLLFGPKTYGEGFTWQHQLCGICRGGGWSKPQQKVQGGGRMPLARWITRCACGKLDTC